MANTIFILGSLKFIASELTTVVGTERIDLKFSKFVKTTFCLHNFHRGISGVVVSKYDEIFLSNL